MVNIERALRSRRFLRCWFAAITFAVVTPVFAQTGMPKAGTEVIAFGSRAGMNATIVAKEGIGTASARIAARITRENAKSYCTEYERNSSKECIDQYLRETKIAGTIYANCADGTFLNFYSDALRFVERSAADASSEFQIIDVARATPLDGTSASGFNESLNQFKALCPNRFGQAGGLTVQSVTAAGKAHLVIARSVGFVPGALICPDHDTLAMVYQLYAHYMERLIQDRMTNGLSRSIHGAPAAPPDAETFGCAFVDSGTKMSLEQRTPAPVVSVQIANGLTMRGVTLPGMIADR
jgi:hypothetical protein